MAKYILNYNGTNRRTVDCAVLDENCIANTYTVQFSNGVIKNVNKKKVMELDHIDEAVLNRLKEVFSNLWDNIVKAGKYVFLKVKGKILNVVSPINAMVAAPEVEGLGFYPAKSLAKLAGDQGIRPTITEDETTESKDDIEDINHFWKGAIFNYFKNDETNESATYSARNRRLHEAKREIKLEMSGADNISTKELVELIESEYQNVLTGEKPGRPICIWGAPGIGKTQIVMSVINRFRKAGLDANIFKLNGATMRKDDFALPDFEVINRKVDIGNGDIEEVQERRAKEAPKTWLPCYLPRVTNERRITLEQLDDIANGGDGSGNGVGGIIFIDEISRISPDVNNVLMQLTMDRIFNEYRIGSKWIFIAAANRTSDMGSSAARFSWDDAQGARFRNFNFVPTFEEWIDWAESPVEGTNEPHILPEIVLFLKEHRDLWYSYAARSENIDDPVFSHIYPTPRQWENVSNEIKKLYRMADDPVLGKLRKMRGESPVRPVTLQDKLRAVGDFTGSKTKEVYRGFASFDNLFSEKDVKDVWQFGDKTDIKFSPNSSTIAKCIEKIMSNCPYEKETYEDDRGNKKKRYPINIKDIENITKFIVKCVELMDKGKSTVNIQELNLCQERLTEILTQGKYQYCLNFRNDDDTMVLNRMENIFNDAINNTL